MTRPHLCTCPPDARYTGCPVHGSDVPLPTDVENLPDRATFHSGDDETPLSQAPTVALAFALGYACARPIDADTFGPFCAMVEELMARRSRPYSPSQWTHLLATLPPEVARRIELLYQAQRGQRWANTGHRHGGTTQHRPMSGK